MQLSAPGRDDDALVAALRAGDEAAFARLVDRHHAAMVRVARTFVATDAIAEEVAQDTWLAVLRELDRFEHRARLKTWIFRILVNRARTRGVRERRTTPFSSYGLDEPPAAARPWCDPERRLGALECRAALRRALRRLPARQRAVVTLRDVEGLSSEEVCELLGVSEGNQRLLLHRARVRLRDELAALGEHPAALAG